MVLLMLLLPVASSLCAQSHGEVDLVMRFLGVTSPEELVEDDLVHLTDYLSRPLEMNVAPLRKLLSCGLFSRYQANIIITLKNLKYGFSLKVQVSLVYK